MRAKKTTAMGSTPAFVPTSRYHRYVPATTTRHVDKHQWGGLALNVFRFPDYNEGVTAPGIRDFGIACLLSGVLKGYHHYNYSKWRPGSMRRGTGVLVNRYTPMAWQWKPDGENPETPWCVNLIVDAGLVERTALETLDVTLDHCELINTAALDDPLIVQLAVELKNEAEHGTPFGKVFGETAAQLLAIRLLSRYFTHTHKVKTSDLSLSRFQLQRVIACIHDNLSSDISVQALADLTGLSAYHFIRHFKRSTGMPPHRYIIHRKMEKAGEMLKHTDWPVSRIATELGYESHSHFSSLFKKATGVTPRRYRQQL